MLAMATITAVTSILGGAMAFVCASAIAFGVSVVVAGALSASSTGRSWSIVCAGPGGAFEPVRATV
jgi:hypothetical protein